ncbi:MAG: CRISPR-associated endonuclease Cas1, partial [Desulfurococcales archaeon]|nr:CRISPR-associated endonuclease Cas1 [Desulfurococcales archaeon]
SYGLDDGVSTLVASASTIEELRSAEARLGRLYWGLYASRLVPPDLGFPGRRPRGGDPVNTALDFLYALLRGVSHAALRVAGLNPYIGFMHHERSGRPSLTLDFMEAFRWAVERLLARLLARGFRPSMAEGLLDHESRSVLASAWAEALHSKLPRSGETLEEAIRRSAWGLARSLREGSPWRPRLGV